jgi:hypothetical protein
MGFQQVVKGETQRVRQQKDNLVVLEVFVLCWRRGNVAWDLGCAILDIDYRARKDGCFRVAHMPESFRKEYSPEFRLELKKVVRSRREHGDAQTWRHVDRLFTSPGR